MSVLSYVAAVKYTCTCYLKQIYALTVLGVRILNASHGLILRCLQDRFPSVGSGENLFSFQFQFVLPGIFIPWLMDILSSSKLAVEHFYLVSSPASRGVLWLPQFHLDDTSSSSILKSTDQHPCSICYPNPPCYKNIFKSTRDRLWTSFGAF